jgi:hypothetical protein
MATANYTFLTSTLMNRRFIARLYPNRIRGRHTLLYKWKEAQTITMGRIAALGQTASFGAQCMGPNEHQIHGVRL